MRQTSFTYRAIILSGLMVVSVGLVGCGNESSPTSATPAPTQFSATSSTARSSTTSSGSSVSAVDEPFTCAEIENVQVRFGSPGFSKGRAVGLFVEYDGAPPGEKMVEITWDELNAPNEVARHSIGEGNGRNDGLTDVLGMAAHFYNDVASPERKQVRINLMLEGRGGQCARVRRVNVTPSSSSFDATLASIPVPPGYIFLEPLTTQQFTPMERQGDTIFVDKVEIET